MRLFVFGKTGQVATELSWSDRVTCLGRGAVNLTDPMACEAVIAALGADALINAAAYMVGDFYCADIDRLRV